MQPNDSHNVTARPGEASPAEQAHASAIINDIERELQAQITQLPAEYQSAARASLGNEIGGARSMIAGGGPRVLGMAHALAHRVAATVGSEISRAHSEQLLRNIVIMDAQDAVWGEAQRTAVRHQIKQFLMDDEIFRGLNPHQQAALVESSLDLIEHTPELKARAELIANNPEQAAEARQQIARGHRQLRDIENDPAMAPYRDRLDVARGSLVGRATPDMRALADSYQAGGITAEEFVVGFEGLAAHERPRVSRMMRGGFERMQERDPAMAAALQSYLDANGLTIEQYSAHPRLLPSEVNPAFDRLAAAGGNLSAVSEADRDMVSRFTFESNQRSAADVMNVSDALIQIKTRGLEQDLVGKNAEQRTDYLISMELIQPFDKRGTMAVFESITDDADLFSDKKTFFTKAMTTLGSNESIKQKLTSGLKWEADRAESDLYSPQLDALVGKISKESGWASHVTAEEFAKLDLNGNGSIDLSEIRQTLKMNDVRLASLDTDGNKTLSQDELLQNLLPLVQDKGAKTR